MWKAAHLRFRCPGEGRDPSLTLSLRACERARPIGAPVVQQGPFVGNTREDIVAAIEEYRAGKFGQWDLPNNGPVHEHGQTRFARYPDGTEKQPATVD